MRPLAVACFTVACLAVVMPAAAQVTHVSVSTTNVPANGPSRTPSVSANGRFVVFASAATNLVAGDTNGVDDVFLRDRDTDADGVYDEPGAVATTRLSLAPGGAQADGASGQPAITPDGRFVAFVSTATNLLPGGNGVAQIYRLDRQTGTVIRVSERADGTAGAAASSAPAISANGDVVAFVSGPASLGDPIDPLFPDAAACVFVREVAADQTTRALTLGTASHAPSISADGTRVAFVVTGRFYSIEGLVNGVYVYEVGARTWARLEVSFQFDLTWCQLTADGASVLMQTDRTVLRHVLATGVRSAPFPSTGISEPEWLAASDDGRLGVTRADMLVDVGLGTATPLHLASAAADLSGDGRWLVVESAAALAASDVASSLDVYVVDVPEHLDGDADTLADRWETLFGVTDPNADPDGDGLTNAQEEDAGTHPNGLVRRFLAEGATGGFFRTTIALANPSPTLPATAVVTFDRGDGTRTRQTVALPAGQSAVVPVGGIQGLAAADVATTVESDRLVAVERSMTWGLTPAIYGSHAETSAAAPSATWFLAEGSTVLGFDLFYLLQNPQATVVQATVRFLRPDGSVVTRAYALAPGSRTTVHVNQVAGLEETDVSGDIVADAPIVVERAMYRGTPGQPFALGTASMGVPAPATSWLLAEGATGSFFDLFVLIANPGDADASVQARYLRPDGSTVERTYAVRAHSRFSVYVDAIPGLEATPVSTSLTSTVPVVAERAMYWPGGFFDYYEGHSSAGSTTTALEWVVAGGAFVDPNGRAQTFVLVANTADRAGQATLTILPDRRGGPAGLLPSVVELPANSRTTIPIDLAIGTTFGVRIQSTGPSPVPLVVESSVYRSADGVTWSAGSNALATPVP